MTLHNIYCINRDICIMIPVMSRYTYLNQTERYTFTDSATVATKGKVKTMTSTREKRARKSTGIEEVQEEVIQVRQRDDEISEMCENSYTTI